jgi:hypothetical protein
MAQIIYLRNTIPEEETPLEIKKEMKRRNSEASVLPLL